MASPSAFAYDYSIYTRTGWTPPAGAALGSFGDKLRKQREQRGLELDAISNTTKISPRMLRALEDEHFDQLPGGVFNKGFVRAYARQVGLDEEEAIADYLAALRESQIQQQTILPDFRSSAKAGKTTAPPSPGFNDAELHNADLRNEALPGKIPGKQHFDTQDSKDDRGGDGPYSANRHKQQDRRRHDPEVFPTQGFITRPEVVPQDDVPSRIPWGKLAAALIVVALLVVVWNLLRYRELTAAVQPVASSTQPSAPVQPAPSTPAPASANSLTVAKPSPEGTLSSGKLSPGTVTAETNSARSAPILPDASLSSKAGASPTALTSAVANKPAAVLPLETTNPQLAKKVSPAALKPPPTFTLLIRAEKTTWVSIVADGKPVAEETLIAPAHTSIRASHQIYVRAGNAAGISFVLNGKEFPAQGSEGEVKTYVFNATGLQDTPQPQPAATNR
jgi:cytoskeletal protein RodZ